MATEGGTGLNPWLTMLLGAVVGCVLDFVVKFIVSKIREKKEVRDNDYIDISGEWFAAWQTSVDHSQLLNTETIVISQRGKTVMMKNRERSPENPRGGYLWHSKMQFYQGRNLMGWYFPLKTENNSSKGIMYVAYFSQQRLFVGKWCGSGYDGELENGFVVITKDRSDALQKLKDIIARKPAQVTIISNNI